MLARKVVFYCGEHLLNFENLVLAADFTRIPYSKLDAHALHWKSYLDGHDATARCVRLKAQEKETNLDHMALFYVITNLDATQPVDKIYGMYGCAKRLELEWPLPDYTKSVAQAYTEATVACMSQSKNLTVMTLAIGPAMGESGLPSWVPDFSARMTECSPSKPPRICMPILQNKQYSGATQNKWIFMPEARQLKVCGKRCDYVAAVSKPWQVDSATTLLGGAESNSGQVYDCLLNCIDSWFEVALHRNRTHNSSASVADELVAVSDLARLLTTGRAKTTEPPDRFAEYLSVLIGCAREYDTAFRASLIHPDDDLSEYLRNGEMKLSQPMQRAFEYMLPFIWKMAFRTADNSCLGMSNHNARPGDLLVLLHGMATPCLIRPCKGGFNFIGAAFVDGIMNGQFWEGESDEDNEWFILI